MSSGSRWHRAAADEGEWIIADYLTVFDGELDRGLSEQGSVTEFVSDAKEYNRGSFILFYTHQAML